MRCDYYEAGLCRSCTLLPTPYAQQLAGKQEHVADLLREHTALQWFQPVPSAQEAFRNKAKMVVTGSATEPRLGILGADGAGVDLRHCSLHEPALRAALPVVAEFITRADLAPYEISARRGELKYVLLTSSAATDETRAELMVRFVLRSQEPVARMRKHLPWLLDALPGTRVVSVNVQPEHKAILEGEREIVLTEAAALRMRIDGLELRVRPQSFFQTNTAVAASLYAQAREWVRELMPTSVWDLYCGVGGFALHLAPDRDDGRPGTAPGVTDITGIELSVEAVAGANAAADGRHGLRFVAADALQFVRDRPSAPELIVVNPPRRGVGAELAGWLEHSSVRHIVYSSCNAESLRRDLANMPSLTPVKARLFDMFPNTNHYEVLVLLARRDSGVASTE